MAMSYAFDGNCADTIKYEDMVIAYWKTREAEEPQNAFYQEGEMANEGARVCIDNGQFDIAEEYYRRGTDFGMREPEPRTHPKSLWAFRLTHALARLAARRGDAAEAHRQVAEARRILDGDKAMAEAQERFFPYLQGYVELYLNNAAAALTHFEKAVAIQANASDPFMQALVGMTHEKLGHADQAKAFYQKAYDFATAHNPPSAFARAFAAKKLGK
jgi:tetratricopeptide (TPR) repeat protein